MNSPAPSATNLNSANYFLLGLDKVVDFATLGEYRVVFGDAGTVQDDASARKTVADADIWATDIEWSSSARSRGECSLPRARDRKLARQVVVG